MDTLSSPISPVTRENADINSELSLVSNDDKLGLGISVPVACLGLPRAIRD